MYPKGVQHGRPTHLSMFLSCVDAENGGRLEAGSAIKASFELTLVNQTDEVNWSLVQGRQTGCK